MVNKIRGKGEGTIYQLNNGRWRAQVTLQGRRLSKTAKTWREVNHWRKETLSQIDDGMTYASTQITVEQFLNSWLVSTKSSKRPGTWRQYKSLIDKRINPMLGKIKVNELRPDQVQACYDHLLALGVSMWTVIKLHTVLHSALAQAFKTGIINRNPASQTMRPKEPVKEMRILNDSQVSQLLIIAKGTQWEALLHLAISTGMRQMELLALRWDDLDFVKRTIKVERQLERSNDVNVRFVPLKTRFSKRTIDLGTKAIEVLRSHNERQHEARKVAGDRWEEHGLLFTTRYGGKIHFRNLLRDYKNMLRKAGLPEIRFHDLRHTAASLMLNHGVPVLVVSRRLGHAKPSITLDVYGHLVPSIQSGVAELIDDLISPVELHPSENISTRSAPDLQSASIIEDGNPLI